jgi:hypothetical protein
MKMKRFTVVWNEYIERVASLEAQTEQEVRKKLFKGDVDGEIHSEEFVEDSLDIFEDENEI